MIKIKYFKMMYRVNCFLFGRASVRSYKYLSKLITIGIRKDSGL